MLQSVLLVYHQGESMARSSVFSVFTENVCPFCFCIIDGNVVKAEAPQGCLRNKLGIVLGWQNILHTFQLFG